MSNAFLSAHTVPGTLDEFRLHLDRLKIENRLSGLLTLSLYTPVYTIIDQVKVIQFPINQLVTS